MKKPELKDFGLNEELIEEYKKQCDKINQFKKDFLRKRRIINRIILICSIVISSILCIYCICMDDFNREVGKCYIIISIWTLIYTIAYFVFTSNNGVFDFSFIKLGKIIKSLSNNELKQSVENYNCAIKEYEESLKINVDSLVQVELLLPYTGLSEERTSLGSSWVCFSNIHLANSKYYPNITDMNFDGFKDYYDSLIENQKKYPPKPKKELIMISKNEKLRFYYPCSDAYFAFKGKQPGDIVYVQGVIPYKILQVINL